jgi:hypothetical protein
MLRKWLDSYTELKDFVNRNPEVKLGEEMIEIPEEYRDEFYTRFNEVRTAFIEEECNRPLSHAIPLSSAFLTVKNSIVKMLPLSELEIPPAVNWYLENPVDGLRRVLYDPLFDLLKNRIDVETFRTHGCKLTNAMSDQLGAQGYKIWVALSFIDMLQPDGLYSVSLNVGKSSLATVQKATPKRQPVKNPEPTGVISFYHIAYDIFVVPNFIIHSKKLNQFVSLRTELGQAMWTATNATKDAEWLPMDAHTTFMPELITISASSSLSSLALIRDAERIARPEMALVCKESANWYDEGWIDEVKFAGEILNPKYGMLIVSRPEVPEEITSKLAFQQKLEKLAAVDSCKNQTQLGILGLGLDNKRLSPIIESFL